MTASSTLELTPGLRVLECRPLTSRHATGIGVACRKRNREAGLGLPLGRRIREEQAMAASGNWSKRCAFGIAALLTARDAGWPGGLADGRRR